MKPIVVPLMGGLGNQLFQIAAGLNVGKIYHREVIYSPALLMSSRIRNVTPRNFESHSFLKNEEIGQIRFLPERLKVTGTLFRRSLVKETDLFDTSIERVTPETHYLMGYFQRFSTVTAVTEELLNRFAIVSETLPTDNSNLSEALAVHIRCGDYRTNAHTKKFHGLTAMSYYLDGISRLTQRADYSNIVIFSDEPNFAMNEFLQHYSGPLVVRTADYAESPISDLLAMSSAKGLVMSNSTFSWWAAWLGGQKQALNVIAPCPWFAQESAAEDQLYGPNWERINRNLV